MLPTTSESLNETLPLSYSSDSIIITSDARIDNRDDLVAELDITAQIESVTDSYLIVKAFEKWDTACVDHLIGDFAFAIYDETNQRMFCARDHFGIKPFYYCLTESRFAFATEQKALLELDWVDQSINSSRILEYLLNFVHENQSTFYNGILRLPPAHCLTLSADGCELTHYWQLDPNLSLDLESDEAYIDKFRELFDEAVRSRLRSAYPIGSFLSGGLDSSSITAAAAAHLHTGGRELQTVSAVFSEIPQCDERTYISETSRSLPITSHIFDCSGINPLGHLSDLTAMTDSPLPNNGMYRVNHLLEKASKLGVRVMLDGHDGDSVVSHGIGYLDDLAREGKWVELAINTYGLSKVFGTPWLHMLWGYIERFAVHPKICTNRWLSISIRLKTAIAQRIRPAQSNSLHSPAGIIAQLQSSKLREIEHRLQEYQTATDEYESERHSHIASLNQPLQPLTLETLSSIAAHNNIEMRYPFFDKRLVEFCVAMPTHLKIHNGLSRKALRLAMKDKLPKRVLNRIDKTDFSAVISRDTELKGKPDIIDVLGMTHASIYEYLDMDAVKTAYSQFERLPSDQSLSVLFPAHALIVWLAHLKTNPVRHQY